MAATRRYVYGLIRAAEDRDFGCIGLEHAGKAGRVYTVRVGMLAAVVSEYASGLKVRSLRKNLDPHHKVLCEVMKVASIVPMTFGHVAKNEKVVQSMLRRNHDDICEELDRLDGAVEMGLKVRWDVDNVFDYFVSAYPTLAAFRDQIFGRSHAPSQIEKMELGRMFEACMEREREERTDAIVCAFDSCFREVKVNPPKNEKMLTDVAFLVEKKDLSVFEQRLYQVAGTFPAQYIFDYNGPWVPFDFIELDLRTAAA